MDTLPSLRVGQRVKVFHKTARQAHPRITVGDYLDTQNDQLILSLRPRFGTTGIYREDIYKVEEVDKSTPVEANRRFYP